MGGINRAAPDRQRVGASAASGLRGPVCSCPCHDTRTAGALETCFSLARTRDHLWTPDSRTFFNPFVRSCPLSPKRACSLHIKSCTHTRAWLRAGAYTRVDVHKNACFLFLLDRVYVSCVRPSPLLPLYSNSGRAAAGFGHSWYDTLIELVISISFFQLPDILFSAMLSCCLTLYL